MTTNKYFRAVRSIFGQLFLLIIFNLVAFSAFAQQGLWLSRQLNHAPAKILYHHRIGFGGWYQPQRDIHATGISYTFSPYFNHSQSELRVRAGYFGTNDKFAEAKNITSYLIMPNGPTYELAVGYSKLFPQTQSGTSYFELALNADVHYNFRQFQLNNNSVSFSTYIARAGIEIIPIPKVLSFYGNLDLLIGTSGKDQYPNDLSALPEKSEYFDAGVKGIIKIIKRPQIVIIPDINLIFTEKRIIDQMVSPEYIVPNLHINIVATF